MMNNDIDHPRDIVKRTKQFALRMIKLYAALPKTNKAQILGRQALRSGTSVGAHCCEGRRARSVAEFVSKVEGALQELDETSYWLELMAESGVVKATRLDALRREAQELTSILVTSAKTAKKRR